MNGKIRIALAEAIGTMILGGFTAFSEYEVNYAYENGVTQTKKSNRATLAVHRAHGAGDHIHVPYQTGGTRKYDLAIICGCRNRHRRICRISLLVCTCKSWRWNVQGLHRCLQNRGEFGYLHGNHCRGGIQSPHRAYCRHWI